MLSFSLRFSIAARTFRLENEGCCGSGYVGVRDGNSIDEKTNIAVVIPEDLNTSSLKVLSSSLSIMIDKHRAKCDVNVAQ